MIKYKNLEQIIILDKNGNFKEFKDDVKPLIGDIIIHLDGSKAYIQGDENNETLTNIDIINDNDEIQNINDEVNALIQALEEGVDPTLLGDEFATAAGALSGSSLLPSGSINRTGAETIPSTVFETLGIPSIPLSQTQFLTLNDLVVNNSEPILTIENIILNTPPVGNNIDVTTNEDTEISGNVIVFDEDDDLLTYSLVNNTSNGEFSLFEDGSWTYLPNNNFDGNDFVDVLINDGNEGETEIRINFTIVPIPEIIISGDSEVSEGEYSFYTINLDKESTQETSLKLSLSYINAEESDIDNVTAFIDGSEIEISEDGIINIPSGITTINVNVKTFPDDNLEGNESFVLNVEPVFGLINSGSVETVIQDQGQNNGDNDIPSISISGDLSVNEGEYSNYLIKLSNETELESKFVLDIQNISTEIDDFEYIEIKDINGVWNTVLNLDEITFPDNVFELELRIKTSQNDILEGNESFIVNVIGTENISNNSQISTTIKDDGTFDDDDRPTVSISGDSDIGEGEYAYYNVLIDKQSELDLNVFVELSNISTKIDDIELFEYKNENNEWISMPNDGILTFIAGVDKIELRVKSLQDDIFENNETFEISVNGLGELLGEDSTQTNILDDGSINDDDRPTVSISGDSDVSEGDYAYYTLLTDKQSELSLEAKVFISNITTNNLDLFSFEYLNEDELWVSIPDDGVLTFLENTNELKIRIGTSQDEIFEGEESFSVNVLGLDDLLGEGSVQTNVLDNGLINDDDRPTVSISGDLNVSEGDYAYYALSIDKQSELDLNVFVELSNISTEMDDIEFFEYKNGNNEWIPIPNDGVLTFIAGVDKIELRVKSLQDDIFENNESFEISVNGLGNLLGEDSIQTNILDDGSINDDDRPTVSISGDSDISEGDYAYYTLSIDKQSELDLNVFVELSNISTEMDDIEFFEYKNGNNEWIPIPNDGILTFLAGNEEIELRVKSSQNDVFEGEESFEISVNGLVNLLGEDSIQTNILDDGSINDDDRPTVFISGGGTINEGDYAYFNVSFDKSIEVSGKIKLILILNDISYDDIYNIEIQNDNGDWSVLDEDGVVNIDIGLNNLNVRILTNDDSIYEQIENFELKALGYNNIIGASVSSASIIDNDNTAPIANDFIIDVFGGTENIIFEEHISDIEDNLNDKPLKITILDTPDYGYLYYFNEIGERIVLNENDSLYEGISIEYSIDPNLFSLDEILSNYSFNAEESSNLLDGTSSLIINDLKISGGVFDSDSFVFSEEGTLIYDHAAGEKGFAINTSGNNGQGDENGIDEYLELSFNDVEVNELKLMLGSVNGLFNSDKGTITAYLYKDGGLVETINEIDIEEREGGHNKEADAFIVSSNSFDQIRLVVESNHGQGAGYVLQGVSVISVSNLSNINDSFSYQVEDSDGLLSESATVDINNYNINYLSSEYINYLEIDNSTNTLNLTKINEEGVNTSLINDIENGIIIKSGDEQDYMNLGDYDDTIYLGDSEENINCDNPLCDVFEDKNIDIVYSNGGNDVIYGENGDDVIFAGNDNDSLYGGNDNDLLYGEDGDDFLDGGDGDDILIGGDGNDVLIGGEGYDIFKLLDENIESNQIDIIVDFESGIDKIDFSDFLDDSVLLDDILNLNIKDNDLELELKNEDYSILIKDGVDKYSENISGGYLDSLHILNDLLIVDEN